MPKKRYIVTLTAEERSYLRGLISKGKTPLDENSGVWYFGISKDTLLAFPVHNFQIYLWERDGTTSLPVT